MDTFLQQAYNTHKDQLDKFIYIHNDNINDLKNGSIIKYIDLNGNLKYGGILIKILDNELNTTRKFLLKSGETYYTLYHHKLYFFYKPKQNKRDIFKALLTEL